MTMKVKDWLNTDTTQTLGTILHINTDISISIIFEENQLVKCNHMCLSCWCQTLIQNTLSIRSAGATKISVKT